jgi:hypothetical protein
VDDILIKEKQTLCRPVTGQEFQESEAPRYRDNRLMQAVRLSDLLTGLFYPEEIFLALNTVRG